MCCRDSKQPSVKAVLPGPPPFTGLNVCVVGEAGVGKTCLLQRFCGSSYAGDGMLRPTLANDVTSTRVLCTAEEQLRWYGLVVGDSIPVQLWDTAGQERFAHLPRMMLHRANIVIMVYSLEDSNSLQQLEKYWYSMVQQNCPRRCSILVVGNKSDLLGNSEALYQDEMKSTFSQLLEDCKEDFMIVETSAKADPQARLIFEALIKRVARKITSVAAADLG